MDAMAASLDCLMKREEKIHRCCPLPGATAESHQRRANGITSDSELRPCITLPSLWTSTNISLVGVRLWRSRLFPRVPWLNTRFVSRFVVCVGFQDLQRLLGTARQQGCRTVVLGSAADNWSETLAISFHRIIHRSCASPGCHAGAIESCPG
jgi:hypothetical protein